MGKKYPSKDELLESVVYDETSGSIRWRHTTAQKRAGDIAGYLNETGYIYIRFRSYGFLRAHRIAWIMVHGCIPDGMQIDHIDGNRANNALSNLRLATYSQNGANRDANRAKATGVKGVYRIQRTGKWKAQIKVLGKIQYLGVFDEIAEAVAAYNAAAVSYFGEYARI